MKRAITLLSFCCLTVLTSWAQCPMCKASVESSQASGAKSVGMGLNVGILMLLASVYIIVFGVGFIWYRNYRKDQTSENA